MCAARQREILRLLQQVSAVQETPYSEFRTRNLFSDLWLQLLQEMETLDRQSALPKSVDQERIQMMLAFIHRNYAEKITLEQIASSAMISKRECLRCFQTAIGKPPVAYLLEYRIQKAEQLLRATGLSVTEIAMQTGFSGSLTSMASSTRIAFKLSRLEISFVTCSSSAPVMTGVTTDHPASALMRCNRSSGVSVPGR